METTQQELGVISTKKSRITVKEEKFGEAYHNEWIRQSAQGSVLRVVHQISFDSGDCNIGTDYCETVFIPLPEGRLHTLETVFDGYRGEQKELVVVMEISSLGYDRKQNKWGRNITASISEMAKLDPIAQKLLRGEKIPKEKTELRTKGEEGGKA